MVYVVAMHGLAGQHAETLQKRACSMLLSPSGLQINQSPKSTVEIHVFVRVSSLLDPWSPCGVSLGTFAEARIAL